MIDGDKCAESSERERERDQERKKLCFNFF